MALFSKKSGPKLPPGVSPEVANLPWVKNPAPIDDDFGDPVPSAFVAALQGGDWAGARSTLLGASPVSRTSALGTDRFRSDPPVAAAEQWVAQVPDDGWGHLVLGALLVQWAWEARGGGYAERVGESAWDVFFERLRRAEESLWHAARSLPGEIDPWCHLIWSGIGLQVPLVVRLEGTNVEAGKKILAESGLAIQPANSMGDGAQKVVAAVRGAN